MLVLTLAILTLATLTIALDNGAALLPPLSLSTANLGCQINENIIKLQIQQLSISGLIGVGVKHILIHDCWQGNRDSGSQIHQDPNKFPSGIKSLIDYAHERGLLIGLGTDIGALTASGRPGSLGFQSLDVNRYASWGVDIIFLANSQNLSYERQRFTVMSQFIQKTGRKIIISIDLRGKEVGWASQEVNIWTNSQLQVTDWQSFQDVSVRQAGSEKITGSGAWNNPGPLQPTLSLGQFKTQASLWLGIKAPLTLMAPLSSIDKNKLAILLNSQLIAINQDALKKQAKLIRHQQYSKGFQSIWGGQLSQNRFVLFFINGLSTNSQMTLSLTLEANIKKFTSYTIRDPFTHTIIGSSSSDIITVNSVQTHSLECRILQF